MSGGFIERLQSSPRLQRRVFHASIGIFALGAAAAVFALLWDPPAKETAAHGGATPGDVIAASTKVPLDPAVEDIARRWILGAVTRDDLAGTFDLTHVDLRGLMTRKEWANGDIPVVPFPVEAKGIGRFHVNHSFPTDVLMQVLLIPAPGAPRDFRPLTFSIGLVKVGTGSAAHWVVNYWAPRYKPPVRLFNP